MAFQPVPTYADPAEVNPRTGKYQFSAVWLSWFLGLTNGGLGQTIYHNQLKGLQGGGPNQFYHLTQTQYANVWIRDLSAPSGITPGASPYVYQNTGTGDIDVIVFGGTVNLTQFSRDNVTYYSVGTTGMFHLSPGDYLKVTYAALPTMTKVPR